MVITSKSNPLIKTAASLSDKKFRKQLGLYLVEGVKSVRECVFSGCAVEKIICTERFSDEFEGSVTVSDGVFKGISTEASPQGVLALVKIPDTAPKPASGNCLLLDCLQDPGNIGTVIRTANAAGYNEIYMINCADPFSPKAVRASMGGIFRVKVYCGEREDVLEKVGAYSLICADMGGENIFTFIPPEKFCLCIGNEGSGISPEILSRAKHTVKIPMRETCESLNAAVSAGIAMYALKNSNNGGN